MQKKTKEYIKQINNTHMHRNITPELLLLTFLPTLLSEYDSDDFRHQSNGNAKHNKHRDLLSMVYKYTLHNLYMQYGHLQAQGIVVIGIVKYKQPSIAFTCLRAQFTVEKIDINFWFVVYMPHVCVFV